MSFTDTYFYHWRKLNTYNKKVETLDSLVFTIFCYLIIPAKLSEKVLHGSQMFAEYFIIYIFFKFTYLSLHKTRLKIKIKFFV